MKSYIEQHVFQLMVLAYVAVSLLLGIPVDPLIGFLLVVDAIKSGQITNAIATPRVLNPAYQDGGRVRVKRGVGTLLTAAAEVGSTIRFFRVKSNDMIKDLVMSHTSFGTGCTGDIGIYRVNADDSVTVRDADFFADAVALAAAADNVNVYRENPLVITIALMEKPLWEQLGYTVDPQCEFEVVLTLDAAATVAGSMCLTAEVVGGH